jgi:hypothetical protein
MTALLVLPAAGLLLAVAGLADPAAVAVAALVAGLMLAVAFPVAVQVRPRRGAAVLTAGAAVGAVAVASIQAALPEGAPGSLDALLPLPALVMLGAAIVQLVRHDGRGDLVEALALTAAGALTVVVGAIWVPVAWTVGGDGVIVVAGLALAAAGGVLAAAALRPGARWAVWAPGLGVVAGAGGGVVALLLLAPGDVAVAAAVAVGALAGAVAVTGREWLVATAEERSGSATRRGVEAVPAAPVAGDVAVQVEIAAAAAAVLLAAGPVYVLVRVLLG